MKYIIFEKIHVEVVRLEGAWQVYYLGNEGKKRKAHDIVIPETVTENEVDEYLMDLLHEMATPEHHSIRRLS